MKPFKLVAILAIFFTALIFTAAYNGQNSAIEMLKDNRDALKEELAKAKATLLKQDSIIKNFDPVLTVKIPCNHARK